MLQSYYFCINLLNKIQIDIKTMKKLIIVAIVAIAGWLNLQAQKMPTPDRYNEYLEQVAKLEQTHAEFLMSATMETLAKDPKGYRQMLELAERRFSDAADPIHNEGLYMAVLKHAAENFVLSGSEKEKQRLLLEGAKKNMIGTVATDFDYVTPNDKTVHRLSELNADNILIFFNNPDCESCETVKERLTKSELINQLVNDKKLIVLGIYPYNDGKLWKKTKYPSMMINGWNQSGQIEYAELYDLPTLPCFYLLDRSQTVLIKNEGSLNKVEAALANPETTKVAGPMPSLDDVKQAKPIKPSQPSQQQPVVTKSVADPSDPMTVRSELMLKNILENNSTMLYDNLADNVKSQTKPETFENILTQVESQAGKYLGHEPWEKQQIQGHEAYMSLMNFEKGQLRLLIVYDKDGKIAGLNFLPAQPKKNP